MSQHKIFKNIQTKGIFCIIIIFIMIFLFSFIKESYRSYKINKEIDELKSQVVSLKNENEELTVLINYLEMDNFAEKEARVKFGMSMPGENTVIIEKKDNKTNITKSSHEKESDMKISNFKKWQIYFFGT
ncbi:septum formation initiator family protein [Patescibacteria group bacterium]